MSRPASINDIPTEARLDIRLRTVSARPDSNSQAAITMSSTSSSLPPFTTPVPQPVFMPGTSHKSDGPMGTNGTMNPPSASPVPPNPKLNNGGTAEEENIGATRPTPTFELPRLRLRANDISHAGSSVFFSSVDISSTLPSSVQLVLLHLYVSPSNPSTTLPPTRSVTLILRDMDGVAYTTGTDLDPKHHKEIHLSLGYVASPSHANRAAHEIRGVLVHELVHCLQYNASGSCPGGLIEGVADFVRLRSHLSPPHWRREPAPGKPGEPDYERWDRGYQHTAYFLDYLETRYGGGTIRRLNEKLRVVKRYDEGTFWDELLGKSVKELWGDYQGQLAKEGGDK